MPQEEFVVTPEGLTELEKELEQLKTVRLPEMAQKMNQAREKESGAMEDNVEYEETLREWAFVKGRILTLENIVSHSRVVSRDNSKKNIISVGSKVTVRYRDGKEEVYHIVGSAEVNPAEGQISNLSPIGQALIGKKVGDEVSVTVPNGVSKLKVIAAG
ncbi:MAG: transcription elongation factor GreA [Chloroflexota bacterium]